MSETNSRFFSVMVVGDNPEDLMERYRIGKEVDKYLKYKYLDAGKLQKNNLKILKQIIDNYKSFNLNKFQIDALQEKLKAIKNMTPFEFYQTITYGCSYDENGDAYSTINPEGKWNTYQKGNHFSIPLITLDGKETTSAINNTINWEKLHLANSQLYQLAWELVKEGKVPENEDEIDIKNRMSGHEVYFQKFKDKEEYIMYNSAYWNYAYLDENGWQDIDDFKGKDIDWIINFYTKFITKLKDGDKVTIYEFTKNNDEDNNL